MPLNSLVTIAAVLLIGPGLVPGAELMPRLGPLQLALGALALATLAALLGIYAVLRARRTRRDLDRLARSVDEALRDIAEGNRRTASTVKALSHAINEEIHDATRLVADLAHDEPDHATRSGSEDKAAPPDASLPEPQARVPIQTSQESALAPGIQPVISVSKGGAIAFDYRFSTRGDGVGSRAMFECAMVKAAVDASRQSQGADGETLPLHISISGTLLDDEAAVAELLELSVNRPETPGSLALAMPAELLSNPGERAQSLERLAQAGVRFIAEGFAEGSDARKLASRNVSLLKLTSQRLLASETSRSRQIPAMDLLELLDLAGIAVIATDVASDDDAIRLVNLGIDLMQGDQFSHPQPVADPN